MISTNDNTGGTAAKQKARITQPSKGCALQTRDEAEAALHQLAVVINCKIAETARMDAAILEIKNRFAAKLATCDEGIALFTTQLSDFAETHPEIFPKDRKSVVWPAGKLGFRTDTPSLALANRTFGWAKILAVIASKRLRKFMRVKTEVDKDAILARCGTAEKPTKFQTKTLPALGLKLVQEEKFFVEPDLTRVQPV